MYECPCSIDGSADSGPDEETPKEEQAGGDPTKFSYEYRPKKHDSLFLVRYTHTHVNTPNSVGQQGTHTPEGQEEWQDDH